MSESNVKIQKIKKSSNVALILVRFAKVFCIFMSVVTIGSGIGFIAAKDYLDGEIVRALGVGELEVDDLYVNGFGVLDSAINLTKVDSVAVTLAGDLIALGVILICFAITFHFMGKVFADIKESYTPFRPEIIKKLKVIFALATVLTLQSSLLIGAIVGFSFWCMFQIFEYGCELQKQSDETL